MKRTIFRNVDDAKEFACSYTSRKMTKDEILQRISDYEKRLNSGYSEDLDTLHREQIHELKSWLANETFKAGNYHQGIDDLILELAEWRAMFYAFQSTPTNASPFHTHVFFQQWRVGGAYAMYSLLGKLISKMPNDKSLRMLWWELSPFLEKELPNEEVLHISSNMQFNSPRFSNTNSRAVAFRNKVIAHNEKSVGTDLDDLDVDLRFLARAWSIINTWSSFGLLAPWRSDSQAFSGLEHFFSPDELGLLRRNRQDYIRKFTNWCQTNLITHQIDTREPFSSISVSFRIAP